jgi:hypothetical protein
VPVMETTRRKKHAYFLVGSKENDQQAFLPHIHEVSLLIVLWLG